METLHIWQWKRAQTTLDVDGILIILYVNEPGNTIGRLEKFQFWVPSTPARRSGAASLVTNSGPFLPFSTDALYS